MDIQTKYSEDEWKKIKALPQSIGAMMAGVKFSGLIGMTKEMYASVNTILEAKNDYQNNHLILAVVPNTESAKQAIADNKEQRNFLMGRIKENEVDSSEKLAELILQDCREVTKTIEAKEDTTTVEEYKQWLLNIAMAVANAAKEGDFFGFGGERFSEREQDLYKRLQEILT